MSNAGGECFKPGGGILPVTMIPKESWLSETLYPNWRQSFRILRELAREQSQFQDIHIVETASHGRVLLLDGCVQITEMDEFIYQEMIVHVPLAQHGTVERVLIVGGGDGGVLRRVLQHSGVRQAVMVEIDGAVIRLVREHMPGIAGDAWHDPRAQVIVGDGVAYLANAGTGSFDIIIIDSTDPIGASKALFGEEFYRDCERVLSPSGIVVSQCGVPFMQNSELRDTSIYRRQYFPNVTAYIAAVPSYIGGFMAIGMASKQPLSRLTELQVKDYSKKADILDKTSYWSAGIHRASFVLPPYIARLLDIYD